MSTGAGADPPAPSRVLYRLFLMLFLRGSSARGLKRSGAPQSIRSKLGWTLVIYFFMGGATIAAAKHGAFVLSTIQHALTFTAVGLFVASSGGEILFNPEEAEILLHRPVTARDLLVAKVRVMLEVSLWLALALNVIAAVVGVWVADSWWFPVVHALSLAMNSVFCVSTVVLGYQLCLHWFGRERLQGLMTTAQIIAAVFAVVGFQILPQFLPRMDATFQGKQQVSEAWWSPFLPPTWFAGFSALIMGERSGRLWLLAGLAVAGTVLVPSLAFGKFARDYERGLQAIVEAPGAVPGRGARRRWLDVLVASPPLKWWFRTSVERAAFLLCAAYLVRDRDTKLRVYPGIAPIAVVPLIFLVRESPTPELATFGLVFTAALLSMLPMSVLTLLSSSQQWRASDLFLAAPIPGPAPLCHGARRATLLFIGVPFSILLGVLAWAHSGREGLFMLAPSILAMPLFALLPCLGSLGVPLSQPTEGSRNTSRSFKVLLILLASNVIAAVSSFASSHGWLGTLLVLEAVLGGTAYVLLRRLVSARVWQRE